MAVPETWNHHYIDAQYQKWKTDPKSVSTDWQFFFNGFELGRQGKPATGTRADIPDNQSGLAALVNAYRDLGHLLACMDPLSSCPTEHPLLAFSEFGLSTADLDTEFDTMGVTAAPRASLKEIVQHLKQTYCRNIGVEYMHLQDPNERRWLQQRMEPVRNIPAFSPETKIRIFKKVCSAWTFEQYLNKKFVGVTRFSLEGGDSLLPLLDTVLNRVTENGCREIILGMAHRGRLNVQTHILGKSYDDIFGEFESCYDPDQLTGAGDVKYHNGYLSDIETAAGRALRIYLMNNPSHLEAVDPVVIGFCRARQEILDDTDRNKVVPLLIHGDAAFAGQGVVAETLNMSQLRGYTVGGTIHIIINNQIGYTTLPEDARSTRYSTDVAKMLMVPIFHVHGEDPVSVAHAADLAAAYRNTFHKDVVIDLVCYRRYGHNEGDEPYFTQPTMYDRIHERPPVYKLFADQLLEEKIMDEQMVEAFITEVNHTIDDAYLRIHGTTCPFPENRFYENWDNITGRYAADAVDTAVPSKDLLRLATLLNTVPAKFQPHRKLINLIKKRLAAVESGEGLDWANAESLAFGSLLEQGIPIRLSGQDCARGTFSHRHSVLYHRETGEPYTPLNHLSDGQAGFDVFNSLLAETGVLGFDYGYAAAMAAGLTLWEAQFGDFANNAQGIIDLFIAGAQSKWQRANGLVMLLPHGWEGLGPEHSSARLERFLQLAADDNIQVCNLTTPAQYFHLLRRQALAPYRVPLVLMTPKSLLRLPAAVSRLEDLTTGTFEPVLGDPDQPNRVRQVIFCSGKIYYQLIQHRQKLKSSDAAIIRVEQMYPFPEAVLGGYAEKYKKAGHWVWVQEEPENMGAWTYIRPRIESIIGRQLNYVGRKAAPSPATGFPAIHRAEQAAISEQTFGPIPDGQSIAG
ncbi:MAG: 2-oxoglutarate dehydrogenase E1 component [Desulfobacteraceae bacterium]|nr:2-oxoglutarate dehydrogenase E1 component [Desulfobacteraceae bacterium]